MLADFRSDTLTTPTDAMREAMARADVGDDVFAEDPTVARLQDLGAELFGKEAAVFTPSGTQANQIGIALHAGRGDEIIVEQHAHPFLFEGGAIAWISGAQARTIPSDRGRLDADVVRATIRSDNEHFPRTKLVCVENTHNMHGGTVVPLANIREIRSVCDQHDLALHIDGARIFNAAVAESVPVSEYGKLADTITCCLSKGLGAPVGSLLLGTREAMARARRIRKVLGGGMRQVGILAAAGIIALTDGPTCLADDHRRARALADGLARYLPRVAIDSPETNIVFLRIAPEHGGDGKLAAFADALAAQGVKAVAIPSRGLRFVLYHQLSDAHVEHAIAAVGRVLDEIA